MLHIHFQLHRAEVVPTAPLLMPNGAEHRPTCTLCFLRDIRGETQPVRKCNPKKINLDTPPAQTSSLTSLSVLISALTSYNSGSYWWGCRKKSNFLNPAKFDLFIIIIIILIFCTILSPTLLSRVIPKGTHGQCLIAWWWQSSQHLLEQILCGQDSAKAITSTPLLP